MSIPLHVVSKRDNAKHAVCLASVAVNISTLPESSVRVQTWLVSLTSNNLTYARFGDTLRWWDVYPVPNLAPAPFNDNQEWGIVPAWGYGRIVESNVAAIPLGSLLWGMWPTSSHSVTLRLQAGELTGHWTEFSPHRSQLMTIYNHYEQVNMPLDMETTKITTLFKPVWKTSYLLNHFVFSSHRLHPFGAGDSWSESYADLSSAVVISLSASTKTGRNFSWAFTRDRDVKAVGPLALLQVTSAPDALSQPANDALPTRYAHYNDVDSMSWVQKFQPSRIVVVDFGAADSVVESVTSAALKVARAVTIIAVGSEAKVYSPAETEQRLASHNSLGKVQLNTSGLRDRAIDVIGAKEFSRQAGEAWERCLAERGFGDLTVVDHNGVEGEHGIEGAWDDLCGRNVATNAGIVVELPTQ